MRWDTRVRIEQPHCLRRVEHQRGRLKELQESAAAFELPLQSKSPEMSALVPAQRVGEVIATEVTTFWRKEVIAHHEVYAQDLDLRQSEADALAWTGRAVGDEVASLPIPIGKPEFVDQVRL